ncbi:MAG: MFS transporter [Defluviitaleaceae bacterium]|nr:MFS transporter [Defluviitaleaceae bacterium]
MEHKKINSEKLWGRDFSLIIIGQIVSLFGNMVLTFVLPLYILDISGSVALFGMVMGISNISLLIISPIGGIMADRLKKQWIMFWLDFTTAFIIVIYLIISGLFLEFVSIATIVIVIIVKMLLLNAIQAMYMPAVQASIPLLLAAEKLTAGNSAVAVVNALSTTAGMAIAGVLYGQFGLYPVLIVSATCFAITAVVDLFIKVPFKKQEKTDGILQLVKSDMKDSIKFSINEKPKIIKIAIIFFSIDILMGSMLMIGLPFIIIQFLGMGVEMVGVSQAIMVAGGIAAGIVAGVLGKRLTIYRTLLIAAISAALLTSIGFVLLFDASVIVSYVIITMAGVIGIFASKVLIISSYTFIQEETPSVLIGKVMSVIMILPFFASALGQLLHGMLFEQFSASPWVVIFGASIVFIIFTMYIRSFFKGGKDPDNAIDM